MQFPSLSSDTFSPSSLTSHFFQLPFITKLFFCILSFNFLILQSLFNFPEESEICLNIISNINLNSIFRIFFNSTFHHDFLHYLFNCISFLGLGILLEKLINSLNFLFLILFSLFNTFLIFNCLFYLIYFLQYILQFNFLTDLQNSLQNSLQSICFIGFSGIIFSILVNYCQLNKNNNMSIFGMLQIKSIYYPFIMLFITSILLPNSSFFGHFIGIINGYIFYYLFLNYFLFNNNFINNFTNKLNNYLNKFGYINSGEFNNTTTINGNYTMLSQNNNTDIESGNFNNSQRNNNIEENYWNQSIFKNGRTLGY
ncbi:hypothetical protein ABK040_016416 [Willaertia magna]